MKEGHQKKIHKAQIQSQEETYQAVSREIHDNISLTLSLSKLHLYTLNYHNAGELHDKINLSIHLIGQAIHKLNNISKSLDADIICKHGLITGIENELQNLEKTTLFTIDYDLAGTPRSLGCPVEVTLFRIIQEALNNIIKHSKATHVILRLVYSPSELECCVIDNGSGFTETSDDKKKFHAGLNNMQIRADSVNGKLEIKSAKGKGTTIRIIVPTP